jgi:ribokinase
VGSASVDLVLAVERIPSPGETVLATRQSRHPGGKGLNQAVAAARAGAATAFVGAVGSDEAGSFLAATMTEAGLDIGGLRRVDEPTGMALITVAADGENAIVVAAGANGALTSLAADETAAIEHAAVVVIQLETPLSAVVEAARSGRRSGARVVLNAAPAQRLDADLLAFVDVLVVNEHEARLVADAATDASLDDVGRRLAESVSVVVVTLGERGACWFGAEGEGSVDAPAADVVDTTGAGDSFTGVVAATLARGADWQDAVRRGVVAGAIAVESAGAVPSIPTRQQIDARLSGG